LVPFLDLKAQYHSIKPEVDAAVLAVLESSQFVLGQEVEAFENEFAAYCQAQHAIGVNSGTSALHLALLAAGIGCGDEVITVTFTFVATAAAIIYAGARPVFVDIEPRSFTMDVNQIDRVITPQTKAILPVHLYGQPADMDPILDIARRHGLIVIEDAAQAHGAEYKGKRVGSIGDIGCFSFYPGKNLGAYGEGGAVTTNNDHYANAVRTLRDWGQTRKYQHDLKGFNYRMEGMQGAVLRVKLRHVDGWTEARRVRAATYNEMLTNGVIQTPEAMSYARHVYHVYAIRTPHRELLQQKLNARGIQTGIHYPIPVHLQPAYADLGYDVGSFPESEAAAQEVLSLPLFPELTLEEQNVVSSAVVSP
jgi:dTDP-4-amino-4,6-dideoxygalactose transaminase